MTGPGGVCEVCGRAMVLGGCPQIGDGTNEGILECWGVGLSRLRSALLAAEKERDSLRAEVALYDPAAIVAYADHKAHAAEQRAERLEAALRNGLDVTEQKLRAVWGEGQPPYAEAYGYLAQAVRTALSGAADPAQETLRVENTSLREWLRGLHNAAMAAYQRDKDFYDSGNAGAPKMPECPTCQLGLDFHRPHCALAVDGLRMSAPTQPAQPHEGEEG